MEENLSVQVKPSASGKLVSNFPMCDMHTKMHLTKSVMLEFLDTVNMAHKAHHTFPIFDCIINKKIGKKNYKSIFLHILAMYYFNTVSAASIQSVQSQTHTLCCWVTSCLPLTQDQAVTQVSAWDLTSYLTTFQSYDDKGALISENMYLHVVGQILSRSFIQRCITETTYQWQVMLPTQTLIQWCRSTSC